MKWDLLVAVPSQLEFHDTALDAVETDTEGRVLLQPGAASHSSERGHQQSWEVP